MPFLIAALVAFAARAVESTNLPFAVETAIRDLSKGGSVDDIEPRMENGERLFDVEITRGEVTRVFILDREGVPIATEVFEKELPAAVQRALKVELGTDGKLESLTRSFDDGKSVFEAEILRRGRTNVCSFAVNGLVTTREISAAAVPKAVRAALNQHLNDGKIGDKFYQSVEAGTVYFVCAVEYPAKVVWLSFLPGGKLSTREEKTPLLQAPVEVRTAITNRLGNPEHVRVTLQVEDREIHFEVLALVGDKVQIFFVLPGGKVTLTPPQ